MTTIRVLLLKSNCE